MNKMDSWKWRKLGIEFYDNNTQKIEKLALKILEITDKIEELEIRINDLSEEVACSGQS